MPAEADQAGAAATTDVYRSFPKVPRASPVRAEAPADGAVEEASRVGSLASGFPCASADMRTAREEAPPTDGEEGTDSDLDI
jgi:hypothetical protein